MHNTTALVKEILVFFPWFRYWFIESTLNLTDFLLAVNLIQRMLWLHWQRWMHRRRRSALAAFMPTRAQLNRSPFPLSDFVWSLRFPALAVPCHHHPHSTLSYHYKARSRDSFTALPHLPFYPFYVPMAISLYYPKFNTIYYIFYVCLSIHISIYLSIYLFLLLKWLHFLLIDLILMYLFVYLLVALLIFYYYSYY